jgi:restriction endonuclease S subunit
MNIGMETVSLEDVCEAIRSGFWGESERTDSNCVQVNAVRNGDISRTGELNGSAPRWFTIREAEVAEVQPGDVLLTGSGEIGKVHLAIDGGYHVTNFVKRLRPIPNKLNPGFLAHMLKSPVAVDVLKDHSAGSTMLNLKAAFFDVPWLPLPSLPEQQRIVTKLDAAFAALSEAQAHVERNQANARELFESYLNGVFEGKGWKAAKLDEVCGFQNGFAFKSNTFREQGIPVLRISNIQDGQVDTERIVFVDPKDYREDLSRYRIGEGDLVIAMSGATTGKIGFNTQPTIFLLNQRVGKFEPTSKLNKRFLYYFLSTKVEENLSISAGSAQPNLSTEQIKSFEVPLPPIQEQERIVAELDSLYERTNELETTYQQKLTELTSLKKAVLGAAFRGEL